MTPGSALYPAVDASLKRFAASSGKEPGDPQKQAKRIIEIVMRQGELPSRFALGVSLSSGDFHTILAAGLLTNHFETATSFRYDFCYHGRQTEELAGVERLEYRLGVRRLKVHRTRAPCR